MRCMFAVLAAVKLIKIHNKIKLFGTSTNMFKYEYRLKSSVQRSIFPTILHTQNNSSIVLPKCMLHPDSYFLAYWQTLILVCIVYIILFVPYSLVFDEGEEFDVKEIIEYVINFFFVVDLGLMFFSAYYDENGLIVHSYKTIACSYFKGFFLIDLITCMPFNLILSTSGKSSGATGSIDRISGLLKIPKLMRMIRIGKVLKFKERLKGTNLGY